MNAFSIRRRTRTLAVAVAAVAALSLTACEDDETERSGGAGRTENASPSGEDAQDATVGGVTGAVGEGQENGQSQQEQEQEQEQEQQSPEGGESGEDTPPCTDANTEVTVSAVQRPVNHLLLTVTNSGGEACFAYHGPFLGFDEAQAPLPWVEGSRPQSVTALEPGESAYAGVLTSSAAEPHGNGHTATSLTLHFAPAGGRGSVGGPVDLSLPGGEVYVDDTAAVTYWLPSLDDALMW